MKRSRYIFCLFIICLVWLSSCATSKNTDTQKQTDYTEDFNLLQKSMESLRVDVSKQTKITTDKLSNMKFENRTVILSPPDSTGKQHPLQESTTIASKDEQESTQIDETLSITIQQLTSRMDSLNRKVDMLLNEKTLVVELSWWDLHKDTVYCVIIGLLLFLFFLYKVRKSISIP